MHKELQILCERCAENIPESKFRQHKIEHQLGKIPEGADLINPATGKPDNESLTPPPEIKPAPVVPVKSTETPKTTDTPIKLKYVYGGTCPSCGIEVETIPLEVDIEKNKKFVVIAWCSKEKRNIQQRMVTKL